MSSAQNPQQTAIGDPPPALVRAFTRLMRPLVRALIARGMTFPYVSNLLKAVYMDVAQTEFLVGEAEPTVSRLSVLTGLQRKDVKRILSTPPPKPVPTALRIHCRASYGPLDERCLLLNGDRQTESLALHVQ